MYNKNTRELVNFLKELGWQIAIAESCTAGLLSAEIASVPEGTEVLAAGIIACSEKAKRTLIGVPKICMDRFGMVSRETACEMSARMARKTGADIGIGITGCVEPEDVTEKTPLGAFWLGFYINGTQYSKCIHANLALPRNGMRAWIIDKTIDALLPMLEKCLQERQTEHETYK